MDRPLLVLGATAFSTEIADVAVCAGWQVDGYVENMEPSRLGELDGLPVRWIDEVAELAQSHVVVCGLGTTHRRAYIDHALELGFEFGTVVHPSAVVSDRAHIGTGAIVGAGCVIAAHASIGDFALVNRGALIGHHTEIGRCSTIGPGSNIAGSCRLGECVYVGMSAVVYNNLQVGERSVIGGGAVVSANVADRVVVAGMPASVRKRDVDGR